MQNLNLQQKYEDIETLTVKCTSSFFAPQTREHNILGRDKDQPHIHTWILQHWMNDEISAGGRFQVFYLTITTL